MKLHCHVQRFSPDAPELAEIYQACSDAGLPLVMHAGREPSSQAYGVDTYALCNVDRVARVLADFPRLKLCVPHLGADEFEGYARLLERHDTLWLDTTMTLADYFPVSPPRRLLDVRPERILFGTDFPNLPYAWDREVKQVLGLGLPEAQLALLLGENARSLYDLPPWEGRFPSQQDPGRGGWREDERGVAFRPRRKRGRALPTEAARLHLPSRTLEVFPSRAGRKRMSTLLVVDDDESHRTLLADVLEESGYRVLQAGNGREALAVLEQEIPEAVLLDLRMPVMSGWGLLDALRKLPRARNLPILIISGYGFEWEAELVGAAGYISKPVDLDTLRETVQRIVGPPMVELVH